MQLTDLREYIRAHNDQPFVDDLAWIATNYADLPTEKEVQIFVTEKRLADAVAKKDQLLSTIPVLTAEADAAKLK